MISMARLAEFPYLKPLFYSYLALGFTDTVHHLHVALILGQPAGMHAVFAGLIFLPVSVLVVWLFVRYEIKLFEWIFLAISALAILVPGIYHGGWNHLVKVMGYLRIDTESTNIHQLLPADNKNLWFYEITGMLEFGIGMVCLFFFYRYICGKSRHR